VHSLKDNEERDGVKGGVQYSGPKSYLLISSHGDLVNDTHINYLIGCHAHVHRIAKCLLFDCV